jgi:hypothetical protein
MRTWRGKVDENERWRLSRKRLKGWRVDENTAIDISMMRERYSLWVVKSVSSRQETTEEREMNAP